MNIALMLCEIKWFVKICYLKIKKYIWCSWRHGLENRCYPRDPNGYWHCEKCWPCGLPFDYEDEKFKVQGKMDKDGNWIDK